MATKRVCRDCTAAGITTYRKILRAGRCATHDRAWRLAKSKERKAKHVEDTYGITEAEYQQIYDYQGRCCFICQRATGTGKRRLAVDHWHGCRRGHPANVGCPFCVRMLLCKPCNRMLGHLRDDPDAFERAAFALRNPPAQEVLKKSTNALYGVVPVRRSTRRRAGVKPITTDVGVRALPT